MHYPHRLRARTTQGGTRMTRKDYQLIAGSISKLVQGLRSEEYFIHHLPVIRELVNELSDQLAMDNPRFNRAKFWNASGLN